MQAVPGRPPLEMRNALRPPAHDAGTAVFQREDAVEFVRGVSEAYGTSEDRVKVVKLTEAARPGVCPAYLVDGLAALFVNGSGLKTCTGTICSIHAMAAH